MCQLNAQSAVNSIYVLIIFERLAAMSQPAHTDTNFVQQFRIISFQRTLTQVALEF